MSAQTRDRLRQIIDELPDSELDTVIRFVEYVRDTADPVRRALLHAPDDDEPETPDEAAAVAEAYQAIAQGDVISDDQLRRELGL